MTHAALDVDLSSILTLGDDDPFDHAICPWCYPTYIPGRILSALCGVMVEDTTDEDWADDAMPCSTCAPLVRCPICGGMFDF